MERDDDPSRLDILTKRILMYNFMTFIESGGFQAEGSIRCVNNASQRIQWE